MFIRILSGLTTNLTRLIPFQVNFELRRFSLKIKPLSSEDLQAYDAFMLIRSLSFMGWYHQRPELDQSGIEGQLDRIFSLSEAFLETT